MIHQNQHSSQSDNDPQQEVAKWVIRLSDGSMKDRDLREFQEWCCATPENALAFEEAQELWQSDELSQALAGFELSQSYEQNKNNWWNLASFYRPIAYATIFLCLCLTGLTTTYWPQINSDYASLTGEIKQVALEDGSKIHLDSKSAIDIDFTPGQRNARLKEGRIHFEVQRDKKRPFIIQAKANAIRVVGTAFDVDTRHDGVSVLVREGIVEISAHNTDKNKTRLTAGQAAYFDADGAFIKRVETPQFNWLKKRIRFQNQTIEEAVKELNEYTHGQIVIADRKIASKRITGSYSLTDIDKTLKAISEITSSQVIGSTNFFALLH